LGAATLTGCGIDTGPTLVEPTSPTVAQTDRARRRDGVEHQVVLTAAAGLVDLGGKSVSTWSYTGSVPGPQIRVNAGDTVIAQLVNQLPAPTSIHWHGVALRNDMDGVPPVTQPAVAPGAGFTYRFVAENPGTYWFHPHVGTQLDRGLYGPLIVEDPHEPLGYDQEWVIVLDDWLDGVTSTPDQVLSQLRHGMAGMGGTNDMGPMTGMPGGSAEPSAPAGMGGGIMLMGATSPLLGGDAGDVNYPYHLINGRIPADPQTFAAAPRTRVRLRIINAGGDTAYRLALGGHRLTITHTDGYPVQHEDVDALLVGMGERYDVLVTLTDGVFPLLALAEGKNSTALAIVRTGSGTAPSATVRPAELSGRILTASALRATDPVRLAPREPDRTHRLTLTGGMNHYDWGIDHHQFDMNNPTAHPFPVRQSERVRLEFVNTTTMWHPMHLHGHTFQLGAAGPRKDTAIVLPKQTVTCEFDADNPGQWLTHCHNVYHGEAGMMGLVAYTS
jgi:FtsP/CotA-like multicopper oxidase with cupredoxin domain